MTDVIDKIHSSSAVVYVAGIETPVSEIVINYGVGVVPEATLTIPADEDMARLGEEDKVPVAIFYLDEWYSDTNDPRKIVPTYRILFDGEIVAWEYSKSSQGDSISFSCLHFIATLGQMFAKFISGNTTEGVRVRAKTGNTVQVIRTGFENNFPSILFKRGMFPGGATESLERPFDFVDNLLMAMKLGGYPITESSLGAFSNEVPPKVPAVDDATGLYTSQARSLFTTAESKSSITAEEFRSLIESRGTQSAAMDFFVRYNHKVKFDQRFIASSLEHFVEADVQNNVTDIRDTRFKEVMNYIAKKSQVGALESLIGTGDSFFNIMVKFYSFVVYEILMLPPAQLVTVGDRGREDSGVPQTSASLGSDTEKRLANYISKPTAYFGLPPGSNILFPGMVESIGFSENYATQPTRTVAGSPFLEFFRKPPPSPGARFLRQIAEANGYPVAIDELISSGSITNLNNLLLFPEEHFKGPVISNITMPAWYRFLNEGAGNFGKDNTLVRATNSRTSAGGVQSEGITKGSPLLDDKSVRTGTQLGKGIVKADLFKVTDVPEGSTDLYKRYTRFKYYEGRYENRNGNASGLFNPYILPGYSFAFLDNTTKNMHLTGLVHTMRHHITATGGMRTQLTYSFGRTLKENYEVAIQQALDTVANNKLESEPPAFNFHAMGPFLPTKTLAETLQVESAAAEYYQTLFYQGNSGGRNKEFVFKYANFFKTVSFSGDPSVQVPTSVRMDKDADTKGFTVKLTQKKGVEKTLTDYNKGMQTVARPICSLEDYVLFINGGTGYSAASSVQLPASLYTIKVPKYIRRYSSADDSEDSFMEGFIEPTLDKTVASKARDIRKDWVSRIERYRKRIHGKEIQ